MLVELLIVIGVLSYLYAKGFLDFGSPYAIFFSVALVVVVGTIGFAVTHYVARGIVDHLFGFKSQGPQKISGRQLALERRRRRVLSSGRMDDLRQFLAKYPADAEVSRRLADELLRQGQVDCYIHERLRFAQTGVTSREEACTIYNRLADLELGRGDRSAAIQHLERIVASFPASVEAGNARRRISLLRDTDSHREGALT